jgi:hypothetical protein
MDIIFILKIFKALIEVAGFALIGQGIVALFAGNKRDQNFVYVIFKIITSPATKFARLISPRFIHDKHIAFVAFALVFWVWVALIFAIASMQAKPV